MTAVTDTAAAGGPLTVLMLSDFCHIEGGAAKVAIDQAILLAAHGVRVLYLAAVGPIDPRLAASPVETICLWQQELKTASGHPGVVVQGLWNHAAYRRTLEILRPLDRSRVIVHLHGYTKALSTSPVAAAHRLGFRIICTLHDFFSACPNGAFFDYVAEQPCRRRALSMDCITAACDKRHAAQKLFRLVRSASQRGLAHFPSVVHDYIGLSERSVDILRPYLPAKARFHSLGNPIEISRRPPVQIGETSVILYVGRLDKEKGVMLLAAAASGLPVTMVGDGPLRESLAEWSNITITGWLSPDEVRAWLGRTRVLIFPSLWYETYGLVVEEAAACGVPAVVSDITAAAERVIDGVTGWHFRSGDVDALQGLLARTNDVALLTRMGQAAYERFWSADISTNGHAAALLDIYAASLAEQTRPAAASVPRYAVA